jgi:hypothetical protein
MVTRAAAEAEVVRRLIQMTVIARASLFGGVLLTGDTRSTYLLRNGREVVVDNLQKVLPLAPYVGIGYSGNVLVAGDLLFTARRRITG